ncbi:MAG: hypothetical protein O2895_04700, partial [Chloroflexi bacterium]|nr:hypothetical protein [Chloroflexota bacterium]
MSPDEPEQTTSSGARRRGTRGGRGRGKRATEGASGSDSDNGNDSAKDGDSVLTDPRIAGR